MSRKQQFTGKHVTILGHIILLPCMPANLCSYQYMHSLMLSALSNEEGTYKHFSFWFDLNRD
jgi:hypothetical protein